MSHKIDLKKYEIRTDLALDIVENKTIKGIKNTFKKTGDIKISYTVVDKVGSSKINKKEGIYITIEFDDVTDFNSKEKIKKVFSSELKKMIKKLGIAENSKCLVVGLGNNKSIPDALGPMAVNNIIVTSHLFQFEVVGEGFRNVSAISPGVMGQTGIETGEIVKRVIESSKPDFVIVVDALASQSINRVNKTIQMTDTGIHPGSGIGNTRKEISKEILGVPVIAIGIPTVVDAVTIVSDTINYMYKHFSYAKENINNPANKLAISSSINYLDSNIKVNDEDKLKLLGIVGTLDDYEVKQLVFEVLTPIGYNLMVTPKEIDFVMEKLADIIGNGINDSLHKNVNSL